MTDSASIKRSEAQLFKTMIVAVVIWTALTALSLLWNFKFESDQITELARMEALTIFKKDIAFRLWATDHGGVYVPVTQKTPPNEYLKHIPERDITTPSGRKLTLMNPAYIIRQVMNDYAEQYNIRGHLTSLNLLNPKNAPDEWERKALKSFEDGVKEVSDIVHFSDGDHFRYIRALHIKKGCLKCHKVQGYKVGDVRGGIGISLPMNRYYDIRDRSFRAFSLTHGLIWLIGLGSVGLVYSRNKKRMVERIRTADKIKASLKEKEILLQEIHHRVKNNMQVINSLLKLQANNIEDIQIKEVLKESQSRVYAMSAVHETLHGSEKLSQIDLKDYLSRITNSVFQTYSINPGKVKLNSEIEDFPISLNQAYPLGLIINELLSNSLKYGFPEDKSGEVTVSTKKTDKAYELTVMDDGIGMPENLDWKNSSTLGLKLIQTLVENQLDGSIDMESKNGTKFIIKFNIET